MEVFGVFRYDYFRNSYSPWIWFETPDNGPTVRIQIKPVDVPEFSPLDFGGREAELKDMVQRNEKSTFEVRVQPVTGWRFWISTETGWTPVATFTLEKLDPRDQEALRFRPFNRGSSARGFKPSCLVSAIRRVAYRASVAARPGSQAERLRRHVFRQESDLRSTSMARDRYRNLIEGPQGKLRVHSFCPSG
jgi:hypothetical protein